MANAIVTEIQETDARLVTSDTWTVVSGDTHYSGGGKTSSSTVGDTATLSFSGRAVYLLTQTFHHGMPTGGAFTYTVDGQSYGQVECQNDSTQAPLGYPRLLVPRSGGMHRAYLDILQAAALAANGGYPEFVTYLFGVNDLRSSLLGALDAGGQNVAPGTFGRHLCAVLCLLEDTLPVTVADGQQTKVAIGTPQYVSPWYHAGQAQASGVNAFPQGPDAFEQAVAVTRSVVAQFPWCRLAQVYEAL